MGIVQRHDSTHYQYYSLQNLPLADVQVALVTSSLMSESVSHRAALGAPPLSLLRNKQSDQLTVMSYRKQPLTYCQTSLDDTPENDMFVEFYSSFYRSLLIQLIWKAFIIWLGNCQKEIITESLNIICFTKEILGCRPKGIACVWVSTEAALMSVSHVWNLQTADHNIYMTTIFTCKH